MKRLFGAAVCAVLAGVAGGAHAGTFTEQVVHYPGSEFTSLYGMNDRGEAVGVFDVANPFIFDKNGFRLFDALGDASIRGINNSGHIIGTYEKGEFLYDGGTAVDINYPGAASSRALDINNNGEVLGSYSMDGLAFRNYIYGNGEFKTLDLSYKGMDAFAAGMNDLGDLAGAYSTGPGWLDIQGFIYRGGEFTSVDHPFRGEFDSTFLSDINNSGQAIGGYINDLLEDTDFIFEEGSFIELPGMYTDRSYPYSINNLGQVSGSFYGPYLGQYKDLDHGFILTPALTATGARSSVPEPSSALLLVGAMACVLGMKRKFAA